MGATVRLNLICSSDIQNDFRVLKYGDVSPVLNFQLGQLRFLFLDASTGSLCKTESLDSLDPKTSGQYCEDSQ